MKKKLLIIFALVLSTISLLSNNFISSNDELGVRNVCLDNNYDISYYENKYDLYNDEKEIIGINEVYTNKLENTSNDDNYEIEYDVVIYKAYSYYTFSYVLYKNNEEYITSNVIIDVIKCEGEIYLFSSNGCYTTLKELTSEIEKCEYAVLNSSDITGLDLMMNLDGATVGAGLVAVGVMVAASAASSNSSSPSVSTATTSEIDAIKQAYREDMALRCQLADDILSESENDYGWDATELATELSNALNEVKSEELVRVNRINKTKFTVFLGRYIKGSSNSYEQVACQKEGSVVFSMDLNKWNELAKQHKKEGMWLLNKLFLVYCISKDCDFFLTTAPAMYCKNGIAQLTPKNNSSELELTSYARELEYIYSRGYRWKNETCANIPATR